MSDLPMRADPSPPSLDTVRQWAAALGFASAGVARLEIADAEPGLRAWLEAGWHGTMDYMARHADLRVHPTRLVPGAVSALMVRMDYTPEDPAWVDHAWATLAESERAYVARYALGRDYHKVVRARLQRLADQIAQAMGPYGYRVFCDSAPVMEVELARRAGLGWRGKHTLLIDRSHGSSFFLGTLYTDLDWPETGESSAHCGRCTRCITVCPTGAIVEPYRLDARRCIAYLTIESAEPIPRELRPALGNRIFGCDDCQLVCPWNGFAQPSVVQDFAPRQGLDHATLVELFGWDQTTFEARTAGSSIRRIGHLRWLRNIAVALGNLSSDTGPDVIEAARAALRARLDHPSPLVREHVEWALERLDSGGLAGLDPNPTEPEG